MSTVIYPSPIFGPVHSRRLGVSLGINLLCQLKFNFADVVLILFCCFVVFWAIASPIISAGGILP